MKTKPHHITKGYATMESYLKEIKDIADQLAMASSMIEDEDLVLLTLNGLSGVQFIQNYHKSSS